MMRGREIPLLAWLAGDGRPSFHRSPFFRTMLWRWRVSERERFELKQENRALRIEVARLRAEPDERTTIAVAGALIAAASRLVLEGKAEVQGLDGETWRMLARVALNAERRATGGR